MANPNDLLHQNVPASKTTDLEIIRFAINKTAVDYDELTLRKLLLMLAENIHQFEEQRRRGQI